MVKRIAVIVAVLGFAAPALAAQKAPVALSDSQLDGVAAAGESGGNLNLNLSPITVNQTAVALNQQYASANAASAAAACSHGRGLALGRVQQSATAAAVNYAFVNYHVNQH